MPIHSLPTFIRSQHLCECELHVTLITTSRKMIHPMALRRHIILTATLALITLTTHAWAQCTSQLIGTITFHYCNNGVSGTSHQIGDTDNFRREVRNVPSDRGHDVPQLRRAVRNVPSDRRHDVPQLRRTVRNVPSDREHDVLQLRRAVRNIPTDRGHDVLQLVTRRRWSPGLSPGWLPFGHSA